MRKLPVIILGVILALLLLPAFYLNAQQGLPVGDQFLLKQNDLC